MKLLNKQGLLYSTLALTLLASAWVSTRQTANSEVIESLSLNTPSLPANRPTQPIKVIKPNVIEEAQPGGHAGNTINKSLYESHQEVDLFAVQEAPAQPMPAALEPIELAPSPSPVPALPFTYLGKFEDKTGLVVYLMDSDVMLTVAQGEQIDENYQLVAINDQQLTFHYRPLNIRQTLPIQ